MKRGIIHIYLFILVLHPIEALTQINFERLFNERVNPLIDPHEYVDLRFTWNMSGKTQTFLNEGLNFLKEDHPQQAIFNFDSAIVLDKNPWVALYYRGVCYKELNQFAEAEKDFTAALLINPSLGEANLELGLVYLIQRQNGKATVQFEKSLAINPTIAESYYFLGVTSMMRSEIHKAQKYYEKCIVVNPKFAPGFLMLAMLKLKGKAKENQIRLFDRAIKADSSFAQTWFWRGVVYLDLNQPERTLSDWNKMLVFKPNDPFLLAMRGELYISLNKYDNAFTDLRKALLASEISSEKYKGLGNSSLGKKIDLQAAAKYLIYTGYGMKEEAFFQLKKAFCQLLVNDQVEALVSIKKSLLLEPSPAGYYLAGLTFDRIPIYDSAYQYFTKALVFDNDIFDAHKKRGYYRSIIKDWKGAYGDLNDMLRIQPGSALVFSLRGEIKFNQKDYYGSIIDLTRYLKIDSTDASALELRSKARANVNDHKGANEDLNKALDLQPSIRLYETVGNNYLILHDTAKAIAIFQRYADTLKTWLGNYALAKVYISSKNWEKASAEIEIMKKLVGPYHGMMNMNLSSIVCLEGIIAFNKRSYEKAIETFNLSLKYNFSNFQAKYYRGLAFTNTNQIKKAIEDFKSIKGYSDSLDRYNELTKK